MVFGHQNILSAPQVSGTLLDSQLLQKISPHIRPLFNQEEAFNIKAKAMA